MEKVSDTHHLVRRNGVWYFRRRVPKPLVVALGKKIIQYSLDTSDKKDAKKRREIEDVKWSARFEALVSEQRGSSTPAAAPTLSKRQPIQLVRDYVDSMDERFQARYAADPPESEDQKSQMRADLEIGLQILENADDHPPFALGVHEPCR